jgi:hypothetical protein
MRMQPGLQLDVVASKVVPVETRGHRLLDRWIAADPRTRTTSFLARSCRCSRMAVFKWLRRTSRPRAEHRAILSHIAGIPTDAWLSADEKRSLKAAIAAA